MGLLDRFKKKDDFDNLPYIPDDGSLPPLPQLGRGKPMDLPPLPPMPRMPKGMEDLPPIPNMPQPPQDTGRMMPPPLPKPRPMMMPALPKPRVDDDIPDMDFEEDMEPKLPPIGMIKQDLAPKEMDFGAPAQQIDNRRKAKVFVQLNKYNDIVKTVHNMESRIDELQNSISKIKDIRIKENDIIEGWNNLLSEAKSKIEEVNRKLPGVDDQY